MKNGFKSFSNRIIVTHMTILIILLYGTVHAQMSSDRINIIAQETSDRVKNDVTPQSTKDDVITMVKARLSEMGVGDNEIYSILANLNNTIVPPPYQGATLEHITGIVKGIIISVLQQDADSDRRVEEIKDRVDSLAEAQLYKMLAPSKDVDFLFEVVIGDIYDAGDKVGTLKFGGKQIKTIEFDHPWYRALFLSTAETVKLTFQDNNGPETLNNRELIPMLIEVKMQAVEKVLGLTKSEPDLIKRINRAYERINNKDWQKDALRFGVLTAYLPDAHARVTSIVLHGYFAYRRFSPGKWDLYNVGRRFSGFLAVGVGSTMDDPPTGKKTDIRAPVLSAGLGFDIVKGFALSGGVSFFSYKPPEEQDYNLKKSWTVGITLNSDLWRVLFNSK